MDERIHITGLGMISSLGQSVAETYQSLVSCTSGIKAIRHLQTVHRNDFVAGEINLSLDDLQSLANSPPHNRTALLGLIAAREALNDAGVDPGEKRTGFISATTVAGMSESELYYKDFFQGKTTHKFIDTHFSGVGTNFIADQLGIKDFVTTVSTACSSAANAILLGARLIRNGLLDRVVVGGTDALSMFTLNGFNTLMILDKNWCSPFDENRKGLNLGEGAAFLVLEPESLLQKSRKKSYGVLSGYANTNDAFHQTASSPEGKGALLSMEKALAEAKLQPSDISYINAHGTGTPNNDSSEGMAMQNIFGSTMPPFSSTKAYTGHTLAAAASIEAVISLLSMKHQVIFPSLNITEFMKDVQIRPETTLLANQTLKHVMSNSFGFGGNCSTLIFSSN